MRLIICGNGFDLHHNLATSYNAYRSYLEKHALTVLKKFESFPWLNATCSNKKWRDVERTLEFNLEKMMTAIKGYELAMNSESIVELTMDFEAWMRFIYSFTGDEFYKWLTNIDIGTAKKDRDISNLLSNAICVTFNYTDTLERVYDINKARVLHLHGSLKDVQANNCIGTSMLPSFRSIEEAEILEKPIVESDIWNNDIIRESIQFGAPKEWADIERELMPLKNVSVEAWKVLCRYLKPTHKSLQKNLPTLKAFLSNTDVDEIVIMGHSLNGSDDLYYTELIIPKYIDKKWVFYCHQTTDGKADDRQEKQAFCAKHGIHNVEYRKW